MGSMDTLGGFTQIGPEGFVIFVVEDASFPGDGVAFGRQIQDLYPHGPPPEEVPGWGFAGYAGTTVNACGNVVDEFVPQPDDFDAYDPAHDSFRAYVPPIYAPFTDTEDSDSIIASGIEITNGGPTQQYVGETELTATPGDSEVSLSWTPVTVANDDPRIIPYYYLQRKSLLGSWPTNPNVAATPYIGEDTSFVDTAPSNGATYVYRVWVRFRVKVDACYTGPLFSTFRPGTYTATADVPVTLTAVITPPPVTISVSFDGQELATN